MTIGIMTLPSFQLHHIGIKTHFNILLHGCVIPFQLHHIGIKTGEYVLVPGTA